MYNNMYKNGYFVKCTLQNVNILHFFLKFIWSIQKKAVSLHREIKN